MEVAPADKGPDRGRRVRGARGERARFKAVGGLAEDSDVFDLRPCDAGSGGRGRGRAPAGSRFSAQGMGYKHTHTHTEKGGNRQ